MNSNALPFSKWECSRPVGNEGIISCSDLSFTDQQLIKIFSNLFGFDTGGEFTDDEMVFPVGLVPPDMGPIHEEMEIALFP